MDMRCVNLYLLSVKKAISLTVSFFILSGCFIFAFQDYKLNINFDKVYEYSGVVQYYNMLTVIPLKFASKFLNIKLSNVNTQNKKDNKNNKRDNSANQSRDIAYRTVINEQKELKSSSSDYNVYAVAEGRKNFNLYYLESEILFAFCVVLVCFVWGRILARGDTEDNIININLNTKENSVLL